MRICWFTDTIKLTALLLALFTLGLTSCEQRKQKKPFGVPPGLTIEASTEINYLTVHYYSVRFCLRCHKDRVSPNFSTYETLVDHATEVRQEIEGGTMPPTGDGYDPLTACQKLVLNTWISAGYPREGGPTLGASGNACY